MTAPDRVADLFQKLERPPNAEAAQAWLWDILERPGVRILSFLNAHAVNLCAANGIFYGAFAQSDHLLRDGSGVRLGCRILGLAPGPNMNGTDLIPVILGRFKTRKIALLGAEQGWLERAAENLRGQGIEKLVAIDGYRADEEYLALARAEAPALIVLGMGMPKQELLALRLKAAIEETGGSAVLVNGGAIIDFLGKKVNRAPRWLRRIGLEWTYRLWLEPKRLARRYLIGNLVFFWHVLRVRCAYPGLSRNGAGAGTGSPDGTGAGVTNADLTRKMLF